MARLNVAEPDREPHDLLEQVSRTGSLDQDERFEQLTATPRRRRSSVIEFAGGTQLKLMTGVLLECTPCIFHSFSLARNSIIRMLMALHYAARP